jgi:TolB protein
MGVALLWVSSTATAQWTNRYPKVRGLGHHVYLEGYDLPLLTIGPIDPAPSPDGRSIAVASRGWLWLVDLAGGVAQRTTSGAGIDSRPAWSPDGKSLAFVRDDSRVTSIVELDVATGRERVLVAEPAINLDPSYGSDGKTLYYSSSAGGDIDIWRIDLTTGAKSRVTTAVGQELQPIPTPDGTALVYIAKGATNDIKRRDLATGEERTVLSGPILSMLRMSLGPDGRTLAFTWPTNDGEGWQLKVVSIEGAPFPIVLTSARGQPLTPGWSRDGRSIYFSEADDRQRMALFRMPADGGSPIGVGIASWDWGTPMGRVSISTRLTGRSGATAARLSVSTATGHPLVPEDGQPRFDGQNGVVFFYGEGTVELQAPVGEVTAMAVQGLATPAATKRVRVEAGSVARLDLELAPVWDARAAGWLAGEHHFHLNYGGPYRLSPDVLVPMARAEGMDLLTPLLANLHTRFEDQPLFHWRDLRGDPMVAWGQEVRAHFLGHIGLIGTSELFWPWIWGPGYEVHGRDDRANAEVLAHARRQGGVSSYVHPVVGSGPFTEEGLARLTTQLVVDGVLGDFDTIELVCLWSDEIGSMELWYRLLNFGSAIALSAGTDVMNNFYRTMAVGTTRVYVKADPGAGYRGYLTALKEGRSVATNGPMLDLSVDGAGPGGIIGRRSGGGAVPYSLVLHTAVPVDSVELVVNGTPVAKLAGLGEPGTKRYQGTVRLPPGGWIAARAIGGPTRAWPAMDSYSFGHTSPIWIGAKGSTTPETKRAAAADLSRALEVALTRVRQAYQGAPIPNLEARFALAREKLLK